MAPVNSVRRRLSPVLLHSLPSEPEFVTTTAGRLGNACTPSLSVETANAGGDGGTLWLFPRHGPRSVISFFGLGEAIVRPVDNLAVLRLQEMPCARSVSSLISRAAPPVCISPRYLMNSI